jgi:hypothetical protein
MVEFLRKARELNLRKPPSVSETLDWAHVLTILHAERLSVALVKSTAGAIAKHQADLEQVLDLAANELR